MDIKNKLGKYSIGLLILCILVGCEKKVDTYETDTCWLSFDFAQKSDTLISYTFVYSSADIRKDTVWLNVKTGGDLKDRNRLVTLKQVNENEDQTAIPGIHYTDFEDIALKGKLVVLSGHATARIPLVVLRDKSLKTNDVILVIEIVANEEFQPGFIHANRVKVLLSDKLVQPANWNSQTEYYLGKYSPVRHQFLIDATNEKWDEEYLRNVLGFTVEGTNANYEKAYMDYLLNVLQKKLDEENAKRKEQGLSPLAEKDGTPISFL